MARQLLWAKKRIEVMSAQAEVRHSVLVGFEVSQLLAAKLSELGRPRIGVGLSVQCTFGLRPGELVRLTPRDIARSPNQQAIVVVRLGTGRGTQVGREQCALLRITSSPIAWSLLSLGVSMTPV